LIDVEPKLLGPKYRGFEGSLVWNARFLFRLYTWTSEL